MFMPQTVSVYVHGFTTLNNSQANVTAILHWQMFWVIDRNTVGNTAIKHVHVKFKVLHTHRLCPTAHQCP